MEGIALGRTLLGLKVELAVGLMEGKEELGFALGLVLGGEVGVMEGFVLGTMVVEGLVLGECVMEGLMVGLGVVGL